MSQSDAYKFIDLRKPEEYNQGHIKGAVNIWRTQITDTSFAYGGMMPTQIQMETLLGQLGISATDTVVIYDQKAECDAARLWWVLKFYGHQNIKLLNGGLTEWKASDGELTTNKSLINPTDYQFSDQPDFSILAMFGAIEAQPDEQSLLLDTRGIEEYSGEFHKKGAAYPGHIEDALNLDWSSAVDYSGTQKFLNADELKQLYAATEIDGKKPVITYCHSGVRSAHTLFVLTELLGYRNIKNYDGSWIEWSHLHAQ